MISNFVIFYFENCVEYFFLATKLKVSIDDVIRQLVQRNLYLFIINFLKHELKSLMKFFTMYISGFIQLFL